MEEKETSTSLKKRTVIFAIPKFGASLLLGIVGFALLKLYSDGYGIDETKVTYVISLGYIAIAISQSFFGWLSDATYISKIGRRKPYIFVLTPVMFISFICLFLPTLFLKNPSENTLYTWLLVFNILFEISYAVTTPYQAWMAEQFSVKERPKVSQIQNMASHIGNGIMIIFTMVVIPNFAIEVAADPTSLPLTYMLSIIFFGGFFFILFYLAAFTMPTEKPPESKPNLLRNLKLILTNKNFMLVQLMQGLASLGWITITTIMLKYVTNVLGFTGLINLVVSGCLLVGILLALYIWRKLIQKVGKKRSILGVFLFAAIVATTSVVGLIEMPDIVRYIFGFAFMLGIAGSLGGWFLFPAIYYADLAEDDQISTGELKAGIFVGFPSIILNLFQALGTFILGQLYRIFPIITIGSFVAGTALTFNMAEVLWGPMVMIFMLISYFYTKFLIKLDFDWEKKR
ncbi:MAG: MFS transporter [Candidatus Lokiarchaeota archaeon]|nr:MFS transporter [Candidatus Lokiarchaeota archaeon]